MTALSIRQPWAWLIANGYKDVENRQWPTAFRGRFLIHASKGLGKGEYFDAISVIRMIDPQLQFKVPQFKAIERGGFVGEAEIYDCTDESHSPWFSGPWGFLIRNATPIALRPYTGQLGFFQTL